MTNSSSPKQARKKLKEINPKLKVKLITISDRAFNKEYETGDLSGKAMVEVVKEYSEVLDQEFITDAAIVNDSKEMI